MKPYLPQNLPLNKLDWEKFIKPIVQANTELARYSGILQGIPNPAVLLSPLTTKKLFYHQGLKVLRQHSRKYWNLKPIPKTL